MASRRPTDGDEEDESTALDLGKNIASATRKPVAPHRPSSSSPAPRSSSEASGRSRPSPPAPGPARRPPSAPVAAELAEDEDDTDYLAVRPSSARDSERSAPRGRAQDPSSAEEDDTEFLVERPTGQSLSLKAISQVGPDREMRGLSAGKRAVPLGDERSSPRAPAPTGAASPAAQPPRAPLPRGLQGSHRPMSADEEEDVTEPPQRAAARRAAAEPSDDTDAPRSMPRVTRFFVAAAPRAPKPAAFDVASQTDPGDDDEPSQPPQTQHRPLPARADMSAAPIKPVTIIASTAPNPFKRETTLTRSAAPTTGLTTGNQTAEEKSAPADGLLVVEVPPGAIVLINGEERGEGPQVRIDGLHRYARHTIKVQAPGYLRWSGSVSLEGRSAAKVRPALKKK